MSLARVGRVTFLAVAGLAVIALVSLGLLTGACTTSRPRGNCWRPGTCYDTDEFGGPIYDCAWNESFDEGLCPTLLRVGSCRMPSQGEHHALYLYAPLHGVLPPDCEHLLGPGARPGP